MSPTSRATLLSTMRPLRRGQWGQAMLEYSTVTFSMLIVGGGMGMLMFGPQFLNAMQIYLNSIYTVVNAPLP